MNNKKIWYERLSKLFMVIGLVSIGYAGAFWIDKKLTKALIMLIVYIITIAFHLIFDIRSENIDKYKFFNRKNDLIFKEYIREYAGDTEFEQSIKNKIIEYKINNVRAATIIRNMRIDKMSEIGGENEETLALYYAKICLLDELNRKE